MTDLADQLRADGAHVVETSDRLHIALNRWALKRWGTRRA